MNPVKLYELLGVPRNASKAAITIAYRALSRKYHPDKSPGAVEQFKAIAAAYAVLVDPKLRKAYDKRGSIRKCSEEEQKLAELGCLLENERRENEMCQLQLVKTRSSLGKFKAKAKLQQLGFIDQLYSASETIKALKDQVSKWQEIATNDRARLISAAHRIEALEEKMKERDAAFREMENAISAARTMQSAVVNVGAIGKCEKPVTMDHDETFSTGTASPAQLAFASEWVSPTPVSSPTTDENTTTVDALKRDKKVQKKRKIAKKSPSIGKKPRSILPISPPHPSRAISEAVSNEDVIVVQKTEKSLPATSRPSGALSPITEHVKIAQSTSVTEKRRSRTPVEYHPTHRFATMEEHCHQIRPKPPRRRNNWTPDDVDIILIDEC